MVVWRNIHEKKLLEVPGMCDDLRWLVLFLQSYQPMRITCHIGFHLPINYDNHLADPSLYLKDWDSHVFFPIGCTGIMQRFWESCSWWRFHTMFSPPEPNWLKKIQVPETHPKRHRPRPCESALEMAELRPIATAFQQQRKNPSIPGKVSGIIIES